MTHTFYGGVSVERRVRRMEQPLPGAVFGILRKRCGMDPVLEVNGAVITKDKENEGMLMTENHLLIISLRQAPMVWSHLTV